MRFMSCPQPAGPFVDWLKPRTIYAVAGTRHIWEVLLVRRPFAPLKLTETADSLLDQPTVDATRLQVCGRPRRPRASLRLDRLVWKVRSPSAGARFRDREAQDILRASYQEFS
jgi:hypothetical protein